MQMAVTILQVKIVTAIPSFENSNSVLRICFVYPGKENRLKQEITEETEREEFGK